MYHHFTRFKSDQVQLSKGQLTVTHPEFIPQLQTFVVLIMLIFFTIELSMFYFSLLLTTIVKFKIKAIHAEVVREI